MNRTKTSLLCGALALGGGYFGLSADAQACRCLPPEVTRDYSNAAEVFSGRVLWELRFGAYKFYLVNPKRYYKGCPQKNRWTWLSTRVGSSLCEASFSYGKEYVFFTGKDRTVPWSSSTSSCSGNRELDSLNEQELNFLNTREVCCGESCACADGSLPVNCFADPCEVTEPCDEAKGVACSANYCGGCNAEFFGNDGSLLCQEPVDPQVTTCSSDRDCKESQYCGLAGVCADDGSCNLDAECNLPGNEFQYFVKCMGYGVCGKENKCEFQCGNSNCIDHAGYDFGDCDMSVGWLVVDGKCENVTSGCGSLLPGGRSPFQNRQQCEGACTGAPNSFACGDRRYCEIGKTYCQETIPGVRPEPGQPTAYYECLPLPQDCVNEPSCGACFSQPQPGPSDCTQGPNGGLTVSIALP